jgi:hypothetical protein
VDVSVGGMGVSLGSGEGDAVGSRVAVGGTVCVGGSGVVLAVGEATAASITVGRAALGVAEVQATNNEAISTQHRRWAANSPDFSLRSIQECPPVRDFITNKNFCNFSKCSGNECLFWRSRQNKHSFPLY